MHKRNFALKSGACLNDDEYSILTFDVKVEGEGDSAVLSLLLPEPEELDAVIGSSKWMVRQATAELLDRGAEEGNGIQIVGPEDMGEHGPSSNVSLCANTKLEW